MIALIVLAPFVLGPPSVARAAGTSGWAVEPSGPNGPSGRSFFVYELQPGASLRDTVAVTNSTDRPLTVSLYARDASSTDEAGAVAYQDQAEQPTDAGSWIGLPVGVYTIPPGTRVDVAFTVNVPDDARPGDHVAGIIASTSADGGASEGTSGLQIEQRIAARVYVRVDGEVNPSIEVSSVSLAYQHGALDSPGDGSATVDYTVRNGGDVRLSPDVVITLVDPLGRTMASSPVTRLAELLPGGEVRNTYRFDQVPAAGRLTARVAASTVGLTAASASGSDTVWAIPWIVVLPAAVVVLALVVWRRRRRDRGPKEAVRGQGVSPA